MRATISKEEIISRLNDVAEVLRNACELPAHNVRESAISMAAFLEVTAKRVQGMKD